MYKPKNIIVVGGNAAGPAAAAKARRTNPDAGIIMFEEGEFISTGTCEMPYVVSQDICCYKNIVFYTPETFEADKGAKVYIRHRVEEINRREKCVRVRDLAENRLKDFNYDKLVLATGSTARKIPWLPGDAENVFHLKNIRDLISLRMYIKERSPKSALIIGSGYIGLELADSLSHIGCSVTLADKESLPMGSAEVEIQHLLSVVLKDHGVQFIGNISELKLFNDAKRIKAFEYEGRRVETDMVLVAAGFIPNATLALKSKLELGATGAIKVDNKLRTSDPDIFAAGDNIEVIEKPSNKPAYIPLATIAQKYGHIAGENAAGGNAYAKPVVKNIAVKVFDKSYVSVGLSTAEALRHNFRILSVHEIAPNIIRVMPGSENVFGKIIYEKNTFRVLGASFLGGKEATGYGDLLSSFITTGLDARALADINYNYTPPLSPFVHLLSVLGRRIR